MLYSKDKSWERKYFKKPCPSIIYSMILIVMNFKKEQIKMIDLVDLI